MMTLLAKGLGKLLGSSLLSWGLVGGLLITGHQLWLARDARIATAATNKCDASWELAKANAERDQAKREVKAAQEAIESERQLTERLRDERKTISDEFAAHKAAASSDPRCLSDSVLDLLRRHGEVGGGG